MRITRNQLQDLINEEISRSLLKSQNRRLIEAYDSHMDVEAYDADINGQLYNIDSSELIAFAEAYVALGSAVQQQLGDLLDMQEEADCNPNAVELMRENLYGQNAEIDTAIEAWEQAHILEDEEEEDEDGSVSGRLPSR